MIEAGEPRGDRSDAELLRAHVAGDHEAFSLLVARPRARLWAVALRTMRDPDDAADALQDAYLSAFRRADGFRGEAQVTTWLHRIVVNACLDRIRHNRVRAAEALPEDLDRFVALAGSGRLETGAAEAAEARQERSMVAAALTLLTADQRAALVLVDMEGYSVEETAAILGCAAGTIKSRCSRGRARLVPLLAHLRVSDIGPDDRAPGAR